MQKKQADRTITIPVPDHPEISVGTLHAIIRQCGIERREFKP